MQVGAKTSRVEGSIEEWMAYLRPTARRRARCPSWPPDVFAIVASILERSGAYFRLVDLAFAASDAAPRSNWSDECAALSQEWRRCIRRSLDRHLGQIDRAVRRAHRPKSVDRWWSIVWDKRRVEFAQVADDVELCRALFSLLAVADDAGKGMGIRFDEPILEFVKLRVLQRQQSMSLCLEISASKLRVLPKQHTSQRGITLRSLTHNLALQSTTGVQAEWSMLATPAEGDRIDLLNVLLLPWPEQLDRRCFEVASSEQGAPELPEPFRFFRVAQVGLSTECFRKRFEEAIEAARQRVDRLHAVILPELALSKALYDEAEKIAVREGLLLIAGVGLERGESFDAYGPSPTNVCVVQPLGLIKSSVEPDARSVQLSRLVRAKNHRWCLHGPQIHGYGLQGRIPTSKDCWELTELHSRRINFLTLGSWMTMCVQICEDLARQDEVTSLIRSVGPNLVVALLMDAPQLSTRWPSRYASILADDPGTSVLTLTSLGMAALSSTPPGMADKSRVIALWRDIERGDQQIELGACESACVIHLVCKAEEEFTADGRGDGGVAFFPVLTGYCGLELSPLNPAPKAG